VTDPLSVFGAANETPNAPFIVTRTFELTFGDVATLTRERVTTLEREGTTCESRAPHAFVAADDVDTLVTLLALFELGVPAMPLHLRWTESERDRVRREGALEFTRRPSTTPSDAATPRTEGPRSRGPESILAVVHTSGSTGQPRGVALSRRAFLASAEGSAQNLGWEANDRWLLCLPLSHIAGLSVLTRCLVARRPVVLDAATALFTSGATLASLVPTQLVRSLAANTPCPPTVRAILVGGAALSPSLHRKALELGYPVLATYGSTETCSQIATQRVGTRDTAHVGPPLWGTEVRIVDGRIAVRGPTLASGFIPNHALPLDEQGWFVTGDRGEFTETGELRVVGRADDVIITGGENVLPNEVEAVLLDHPDVTAACVVGIWDLEFGQRLFALLVTHSGTTPRDLEGYLRARLAGFKVPRGFLVVPSLPLGATGKVDRRAALDLATHSKPSSSFQDALGIPPK
jgi:o-succinylbenzoate---CoA ligase